MKNKIILFLIFVIFMVFVLFSSFFKIDTFLTGYIYNLNSYQVIYLKKDNKTHLYKNKNLHIKTQTSDFYCKIDYLYEDNENYYFLISKKITNLKNNNVYIYDKKIILGEYIIKEFF